MVIQKYVNSSRVPKTCAKCKTIMSPGHGAWSLVPSVGEKFTIYLCPSCYVDVSIEYSKLNNKSNPIDAWFTNQGYSPILEKKLTLEEIIKRCE